MTTLVWALLLTSAASAQEAPPISHGDREDGFEAAVSIGYQYGSNAYHSCTASIITPRLVLTAAHCLDGYRASQLADYFSIFVGSSINNADQVLAIEDRWIHRDYESSGAGTSSFRIDYDIGVILLEDETEIEPVIVRLDEIPGDERGRELFSVGYGATSDAGGGSGRKRSTTLELTRLDGNFLESETAPGDGQICSGDSGGPQFAMEGERWVQWGIHSWGDSYCEYSSGSFRPDITADWLLEIVEEVHGTQDLCEINWHDDGVCDDDICPDDPDCFVAEVDTGDADGAGGGGDVEGCGGCATAPAGAPGLALLGLLGLLRRRARTGQD